MRRDGPVELLLCSAGLGALPTWLDEQDGSRVVSFVDTAARPLDSAPFVDDCRAALADAGCGIEDLDLTTAAPDDVAAQLSRSSHVFVTGRHPVFLLEWAQRSGFLRTVRSSVRAGHLRPLADDRAIVVRGEQVAELAST